MGRRYLHGAELNEDGADVRVWAPDHQRVTLIVDGARRIDLAKRADGFFGGAIPGARHGTRYAFEVDGRGPLPDPASRWQPEGPHAASAIVDPRRFRWTDRGWRGAKLEGQILYEMHIGTFTPEGTWQAATAALPALAALGITAIEVMPIADFPGRFGWGYDGVALWAPAHQYGAPDDLRAFVDAAHGLGIAVILDVVYNHIGPDGNYLGAFSPSYFTKEHTTDWGEAINYDGDRAGPSRAFFVENGVHWIVEYHFDGLRLDATQNIYDASEPHVLAELTRRAREAAGDRPIFFLAENESQTSKLARPLAKGGYGVDGLWNDDFHHSALVALTGRTEAYYTDYAGSPQELLSALKHGYLYQGQRYTWQKQRRGAPALDLPSWAFVTYLENHDQVANSATGARVHALSHPAAYRALTALFLLGPGTPMLFQGQEFASSAPFAYFADHNAELAPLVEKGRREFMAQFPSVKVPAMTARIPPPHDPKTFDRCKLDPTERDTHVEAVALHRDLIALRKSDPTIAGKNRRSVDGAVVGANAFVLRMFGADGGAGDRLLLVNLGADQTLTIVPEPLLAPPEGMRWAQLWSSEDPKYGGGGAPPPEDQDGGWHLVARSCVVVAPVDRNARSAPHEPNEPNDTERTS